jgi:alkylated DNA repair dioxygenase AlkB
VVRNCNIDVEQSRVRSQQSFSLTQRVVSFGWRYDFSGATLRPSDDIPPFLLPLRERAAAFAGIAAAGLQQILINEYAPGAGIG